MEKENKILEYCKKLEGISYHEWQRVKMVMDNYFRTKTGQLQQGLKLTDLVVLAQESRFY